MDNLNMEESNSTGFMEQDFGDGTSRSRLSDVFSKFPYFGKRRKNTMKHMVPSLECQNLKAGDREFPEQCEMLLETPEGVSKKRNLIHDKYFKGILIASIFLCFSISVTSIMWLTNIYDNSILKLVSIRNDVDLIFNLWRTPPTRPFLSVYIFNYTNHERALDGLEKPTVQEVGPYVFRERMQRINIKFNSNNTVSFQENKTVEFIPEMSNGPLNSTIIIPNIPVLSTLKRAKNFFFVSQNLVSTLMTNLQVQPFQNVSVYDFIWGYGDNFFHLLQNITHIMQRDVPSQFGFLKKRRGVHHDVITMNTGLPELKSVGQITRFDGMDRIGVWGDTKCDQIEASDGSLFPGNKAYAHEPLYIYAKDMCRRLPIYFNKTTKSADGFTVLQYNIPDNLFDYSSNNDENTCYKFNGEYPPNGVFNSGPCQNDAPTYASFPHFLHGDAKLRENIKGLNPNPEKHHSMFLIHERLGVCLLARTRFQLNFKLEKASFIKQFSRIQNGTIFPIAWLEYNSGPLPEYFVNVVYHLTYTVRTVQIALQWITLLCLIISFIYMYKQIHKCYF